MGRPFLSTPRFWTAPTSLAATLLRPAAMLWGAAASQRLSRTAPPAPIPVICIGNPTAGGAGKTPVALAMAARFAGMGLSPAFVTRGYGGRIKGPAQVDPGTQTAADVGDEALLLARRHPTIVAQDRHAGATLAAWLGADIAILDDGLQNRSVAKDLTLAVVDGETGLGNGLCLPAGPLRAPMAAQWPLIDFLIVMGDGFAGERVAQEADARGVGVIRARLAPDPAAAAALAGVRVLAFAGIGRPEKFFATLREWGVDVAGERPFPDHQPYRPATLRALARDAAALGAIPVTTEKDAARIGADAALFGPEGLRILPVSAVLPADTALDARIQRLAWHMRPSGGPH